MDPEQEFWVPRIIGQSRGVFETVYLPVRRVNLARRRDRFAARAEHKREREPKCALVPPQCVALVETRFHRSRGDKRMRGMHKQCPHPAHYYCAFAKHLPKLTLRTEESRIRILLPALGGCTHKSGSHLVL